MVFAAMQDKDLHLLGEILFPFATHLLFTAPDNPRAWAPETMRELSRRPDAQVAVNTREALARCEAAAPEDLILITGSLYLVGEARRLLCV
jgi:dihydrofolate synthase/folylpolyglutamate synthase